MAFSLNEYTILEEIGRGGFGVVLKARQNSLDRTVVIKMLPAQNKRSSNEILSFRREAQAMAMLSHDNIITVYDYGFSNDSFYIIMEYVDGMDFDRALATEMPRHLCLLVIEKVIRGLMAAHDANVIHRDIKPGNILLGKQGQVKLADFGLARVAVETPAGAEPAPVLGTFSYMAPEAMVTPKLADRRVDIFSLGCVMYRAVCGEVPFPGKTPGEVSCRALNEEPAPLAVEPPLKDLADIIMQCLRKNRDERPGLPAIDAAVINALGSRYHAAEKELQAFVRSGRPSAQPAQKNRTAARPRTRRGARIVAACAAAGLLIAGALVLRQFSGDRPSKAVVLPTLPGAHTLPAPETPPPLPAAKKLADDAPKPVTGGDMELTQGTLVVTGIAKGDSITVNGRPVDGPVKKGRIAVTLTQGLYRIIVYRAQIPATTRDVRIMPYQVFTLALKKERDSDE